MKKRICKFEIKDMLPIGMTLVVLGIAIGYGIQVVGEVHNDFGKTACTTTGQVTFTKGTASWDSTKQQCVNGTTNPSYKTPAGTAEFNGTQDTMTAVAKIPDKLPTIVTVIVAAVLIGILITYMAGRFMGK